MAKSSKNGSKEVSRKPDDQRNELEKVTTDDDRRSLDLGHAPLGYPVDWYALVQSAVYRLGQSLGPRVLQTLSKGLRVITYGGARQVAFVLSFSGSVLVSFFALLAAASMGLHFGVPVSIAIVLFLSIVCAVIGTAVAVQMGRLTTPELEYALALFELADAEYEAINEQAEQLLQSGKTRTQIHAELEAARRKAFEALMSGLRKIRHVQAQKLAAALAEKTPLSPGAPETAPGVVRAQTQEISAPHGSQHAPGLESADPGTHEPHAAEADERDATSK